MEDLLQAALEAKKNAHAPYSQCLVGAAVRTDDGGVFSGCNVENASYGATICAERNAICQAVAKGQKNIVEILIVTDGKEAWPPCGMCRQTIVEFAQPDTPIHCHSTQGDKKTYSLQKLLPHAFNSDFL